MTKDRANDPARRPKLSHEVIEDENGERTIRFGGDPDFSLEFHAGEPSIKKDK